MWGFGDNFNFMRNMVNIKPLENILSNSQFSFIEAELYLIMSTEYSENVYWQRNDEHGCGWSSKPKQAFSRSLLQKEIGFMANNGYLTELKLIKLYFKESPRKHIIEPGDGDVLQGGSPAEEGSR